MKKWNLMLFLLCCSAFVWAQTTLGEYPYSEAYLETVLSRTQLQTLATEYSVDKVSPRLDGQFDVRLCIFQRQYQDFCSLKIPYTICATPKPTISMATRYQELVSEWNRYPTYETYLATMDTFQSQFPQLCKIDTVLAQTPNNHMILAAHISNNLQDKGAKPSFWYSSTIHGDEPVGYYFMLHLIHYLLNNYYTDDRVRYLVDNVDIWITPLENPDGTYNFSNNSLNVSPWSTRANAHGVDLNRSYPFAGISLDTLQSYEPEIEAMMAFGTAHHFTMSGNFHGGAELVNYPWDTWTTYERNNPDRLWWMDVCQAFADTCQSYSSSYMTEETDGVTEGGDWYVITGSRQDYFGYHAGCREATFEISSNKVLQSNRLPEYWNNIHASLLNYMAESLNGFSGVVTDSISGQPLEALVFVENHDDDVSFVKSFLPAGDYHRPIQAGVHTITFSAPGYVSKTVDMSVLDGQSITLDAQLVPVGYGVDAQKMDAFIAPNPAHGTFEVHSWSEVNLLRIYDVKGKLVKMVYPCDSDIEVDMKNSPAGIYFICLDTNEGKVVRKIVLQGN